MPKIRRVILENIQSHRYSEIEFAPTVTVLVGESDRGKSAVVRALRWLFYNRPQGEGLMRVGSTRCRVAVELEDGTVIEREREGRGNRYCIHYPGGETLRLESPGRSVPREVEELTGVRPYLVANQPLELHLAHQLDPPFLLRESPSLRAQVIGQVARADLFQQAAKLALKEQSQYQSRIKGLEVRLEQLQEESAPLQAELSQLEARLCRARELAETVREMEERRQLLDKLRTQRAGYLQTMASLAELLARLPGEKIMETAGFRLEELEHRYGAVASLAGRRRRFQEEKSREEATLAALTSLPGAEQQGEELVRQGERLTRLRRFYQERERCLQQLHYWDALLPAVARLEEAEASCGQAEGIWCRYRELQRFRRERDDRRGQLAAEQKQLLRQEEKLRQRVLDYQELLRRLQRCPLCGAELTSEHAERAWREDMERMGISLE
ncbi:AAA family ATPase [Desulfothermobacter acidiphilus]|uniref:AAA family ATPase n=1 Tax=Desulfothermobacter acidiphilus TaxID=1938353 RepID=UPI003F8C176C